MTLILFILQRAQCLCWKAVSRYRWFLLSLASQHASSTVCSVHWVILVGTVIGSDEAGTLTNCLSNRCRRSCLRGSPPLLWRPSYHYWGRTSPLEYFCPVQVSFEEIVNLLDSEKIIKTVQKFTDIYFHLPGLPNNGNGTESNWIRVRNCEGRFALLIREVFYK